MYFRWSKRASRASRASREPSFACSRTVRSASLAPRSIPYCISLHRPVYAPSLTSNSAAATTQSAHEPRQLERAQAAPRGREREREGEGDATHRARRSARSSGGRRGWLGASGAARESGRVESGRQEGGRGGVSARFLLQRRREREREGGRTGKMPLSSAIWLCAVGDAERQRRARGRRESKEEDARRSRAVRRTGEACLPLPEEARARDGRQGPSRGRRGGRGRRVGRGSERRGGRSFVAPLCGGRRRCRRSCIRLRRRYRRRSSRRRRRRRRARPPPAQPANIDPAPRRAREPGHPSAPARDRPQQRLVVLDLGAPRDSPPRNVRRRQARECAVHAARNAPASEAERVVRPGGGGGRADEGEEERRGGLREGEERGKEVGWEARREGEGRVEEAEGVEGGREAVRLVPVRGARVSGKYEEERQDQREGRTGWRT